jgi:hypothetical protein
MFAMLTKRLCVYAIDEGTETDTKSFKGFATIYGICLGMEGRTGCDVYEPWRSA